LDIAVLSANAQYRSGQAARRRRLEEQAIMALELNLEDAWAKLSRGREHAAELRRKIEIAGAPDYHNVSLRREFDPESSCIVYRIAQTLEIQDRWGIIAGDAIHSFRCSLDYLAWQLAIRHYNGGIPPKVAKNIYFPIVYEKEKWRDRIGHMSAEDASKIERSQPFNFSDEPTVGVPLDMLAKLSNADKHQKINIISHIIFNTQVVNDGWPFRDCVPSPDANRHMQLEHRFSGKDLPHEEVLRLHIVPTGENPDAEINVRVTREVVFQQDDRTWPVIPTLHFISIIVEKILNRFDNIKRPALTPENFPNITLLESESPNS
jgi:hypothetical protein